MLEIIKIAGTGFSALVTGIALAYFKFWLDNRSKPGTTFDADLDRRNRVKEFLLDSLSEFRPARTACYLLHNGGILFNGDHMQKIKLYEECTRDKSVALLRKDFESVLIEGGIHHWIDGMRLARRTGPYEETALYHDGADINPETKAFIDYYRMKCVYSMLIRNPQTNAPIAIYTVSFDHEMLVTPVMLVGLRAYAHRLEKILLKK